MAEGAQIIWGKPSRAAELVRAFVLGHVWVPLLDGVALDGAKDQVD
jgi:hypothetical protein